MQIETPDEERPRRPRPWMRAGLFLLGAVSLAVSALAARPFLPLGASNRAGIAPPVSGMELLDSFRCRWAETKTVQLRGIEDNYSSLGSEPARPHPRHDGVQLMTSRHRPSDFDGRYVDAMVGDYFEFAPSIASGLLVVRMRPILENLNDAIIIGDHPGARNFTDSQAFHNEISKLESLGWRRDGDVYSIAFADLVLNSGETLIDFIRTGPTSGVVDVIIADDTSVDFFGATSCAPPDARAGLTYAFAPNVSDAARDIAAFYCASGEECDPFAGDTPCERALPLLCFRDVGLPAPAYPSGSMEAYRGRRWSGGEVAATAPIAASDLATITDADARCAQEFGPDWRTADWHLGGLGKAFLAKAGGRRFEGRYWIDVKDQPYGACWSRASAK